MFNKQGDFRPKGRKTTAVPRRRKTTIGYPTPHLVNFTDLLEEEKRQMRNEGYAASAPTPNDEELQALVEEGLNSSASAQAPPVAAQRTMSPPTVPKNIDKGGNVNEPTAQSAVVVGMKPPHPRNWLENM